MAFQKQPPAANGQNLPATQDGPRRRSKLLGGVNARAVGEAVLVSALLSVLAFWQGDLLSAKLDIFLDDGRLWPADGLLALIAAGFVAMSKKVKPINKIRVVPALGVYGFNSIYGARMSAGLITE